MKKRLIAPLVLCASLLLTSCGADPIDQLHDLIGEAVTIETDYLRSKKDRDAMLDDLYNIFHKIDAISIDDIHARPDRINALGYINDFTIACIGKEEDQRMIEARNNLQALLEGDE